MVQNHLPHAFLPPNNDTIINLINFDFQSEEFNL